MDENRDNQDTNSGENFSELIKEYDLKAVDYETPVEGTIIEIQSDTVVLDIGQKTEGILKKEELLDWDGSFNHKVGDSVTVKCQRMNRQEGYIIVSKKSLEAEKGWEKVSRAYEQHIPILGKIVRAVPDNKGYIVDMGVDMFLPMSQVQPRRVKTPQKWLGKELWFQVTRLNPKDKSGVVSHKAVIEEERKEKVKELMDTLKTGEIVKGTVVSLTDYGAFVDIGGVDGLLHKDNISYGRVTHPREKLRRDDEIEVKILDIDPESQRISLGLKQKYPDPWIDIEHRYPVGTKVMARVTKIVDFGAFIELEEGVEGLMHISDLTWTGKPKRVEEYVAVDENIWVQVIELNPGEKKIKLGLKQLELRPEEKYMQSHRSGEVVEGTVKKVLKSRAFIELEPGVEGIIKISDISYFRIDSPKEFLKEGDPVKAMIISDQLDQNYKVKLSLKHLTADEWDNFFASHNPGNVIEVTIKKVTEKGISAAISKNIEGFIKLSEIDDKHLSHEEIAERVKEGEKREALIMNMMPEKKRIYLSLKAVSQQREREDIEKYLKSGKDSVTTIGDLLENEIDKKK